VTGETVVKEAIGYDFIEGILYQKFSSMENNRRTGLFRLVIPLSMRATILRENHNESIAGHLGIKRTYCRLTEQYYWKGMYNDVKEWIAMCDDCCTRKTSQDKNQGLIQTINSNRPFQIVGTDITGPFPKIKEGKRYIITFTDHFTKWVEAVAIEKGDAKTVANCFIKNVILRHGAPEQILSDRGKAFIREMMTEIENELEIKQSMTTAYHPQTNGLTE
jgi:transposase InsO family protein